MKKKKKLLHISILVDTFAFVPKKSFMHTPSYTREDLLKKIQASKKKKQERIAEMEKRLKEIYKEKTGKEPQNIYSL